MVFLDPEMVSGGTPKGSGIKGGPMSYIVLTALFLVVAAGLYWFGNKVAKTEENSFRSLMRLGSIAVAFVAVPLFSVWSSVYQVPAGYVGVVYRFTNIVGQTGEGLQWTAPWQAIFPASVRVEQHPFPKLDSFSKESQDVFVAATVNVRVSPEDIQGLYRSVGPRYFDILVVPRVHQYFKDETVKYSTVDIAPHREAIRKTVRERLTHELRAHSIIVDDLLIDNITFSKGFQDSIENKQIQTQNALAEKEKVEAERQKAFQAVETARGNAESILIVAMKQAEANRALAESITPELIQYLMVQKLSPNINVMMVPTGQQFILGSDILKGVQQKQ